MNIELHEGKWYANGYTIVGNVDEGYAVFEGEELEDGTIYCFESSSFEECLTWVYNS